MVRAKKRKNKGEEIEMERNEGKEIENSAW